MLFGVCFPVLKLTCQMTFKFLVKLKFYLDFVGMYNPTVDLQTFYAKLVFFVARKLDNKCMTICIQISFNEIVISNKLWVKL